MIRLKKLLEQTYSKPKTPKTVKRLPEQNPVKKLLLNIFDFIVTPGLYGWGAGPGKKYIDTERRGIDIYNKLADIVKHRIEYNTKNNLPLDRPTVEETAYRNKLYKSAPTFGYSNMFKVFDILSDIEQGKQNSSDVDLLNQIHAKLKSKNSKDVQIGKKQLQYRDARYELKAMALGLDVVDGLSKGYWVKSEFKPQKGKDGKTTIYIRPSKLPVLNTKQFDTLYNLILLTKVGGKFPGGNSVTVKNRLKTWMGSKSVLNIFSNDQYWDIFGQMGTFKFGCGEENGTSFISIYDLWDLAPNFYNVFSEKGAQGTKKSSIDLSQFLHAPEIYYRIYRPEPGKSLVPLNYTKYTKDGKVKK